MVNPSSGYLTMAHVSPVPHSWKPKWVNQTSESGGSDSKNPLQMGVVLGGKPVFG